MSEQDKWCYEVPGKLEVPYRYFAGEFCSKFLTTLRDEKKILGSKCPRCKKVFIPPRSNCEQCFVKIQDWVEVGPKGKVTSFCIVRYQEPYLPLEPPYVLALIRLSGADSDLTHLIRGIDPEQVRIGMEVAPVFSDQPKAGILTIKYFQPVS